MASNLSTLSSAAPPRARLRGVVFDMDGTLTVPVIDFAAMYRAVLGEDEYVRIKAESPSGIDILHHIETWSPEKQRKAYDIIADYESQGLDRLQIMPGERVFLCWFWLSVWFPGKYRRRKKKKNNVALVSITLCC